VRRTVHMNRHCVLTASISAKDCACEQAVCADNVYLVRDTVLVNRQCADNVYPMRHIVHVNRQCVLTMSILCDRLWVRRGSVR
jgi:hypothetical protein